MLSELLSRFRRSAHPFAEATDAEVAQAIRLIPKHYAVGPTNGTDGTTPATVRYGKTGEQTVQQAHGKLYEAASRGVLFSACDQGVGIATTTTLSTTSILSLYNPAGSGKILAVKKTSIVYFSGTLGTGVVYHCGNATPSQTAPSSGTLLTATNLAVGNSSSPVGVVRTASTVVQPVILFPAAYLAPELASSVSAPQFGDQEIDGAIIVLPGCTYQLQSVAAAGTSPKLSVGIIWEEVTQL